MYTISFVLDVLKIGTFERKVILIKILVKLLLSFLVFVRDFKSNYRERKVYVVQKTI